jgi:hypothetical protein
VASNTEQIGTVMTGAPTSITLNDLSKQLCELSYKNVPVQVPKQNRQNYNLLEQTVNYGNC